MLSKELLKLPAQDLSWSEQKPRRKFFKLQRKVLIPLLIAAVVLLVGGVLAYYFQKATGRVDAVDMLPEDTVIYLRFKVDPEEEQVKNFKSHLEKFPGSAYFQKAIGSFLKEIEKDTPVLKDIAWTELADEVLVAVAGSVENLSNKETPLIVILSSPNKEELKEAAEKLSEAGQLSKAWQIEKETYKGRVIVKAIYSRKISPGPSLPFEKFPQGGNVLPSTPQLEEPSPILPKIKKEKYFFTFSNNHLVFSTRLETLKTMIDIADSRGLFSKIRGREVRGLADKRSHQKIIQLLPADYLGYAYAEIDNGAFSLPKAVREKLNRKEGIASSLPSLMVAALSQIVSPVGVEEKGEKVVSAVVFSASKKGFQSENYTLDETGQLFTPSLFNQQEGLASKVPAKFNNLEIISFSEIRNLTSYLGQFYQQMQLQNFSSRAKKENLSFEEALKAAEKETGIDLSLLAELKKNAAFLVAADRAGKAKPVFALIAEIDNPEKVRQYFDNLKLPEAMFSPFESSFSKTGIFPGSAGYCTGYTFRCPSPSLEGITESLPEEKMVNLPREVVGGQEIYGQSFLSDLGSYFTIKDQYLIAAATKEGVITLSNALSEFSSQKFADNVNFREGFKEAPEKITTFSYNFPYGFVSVLHYLVDQIAKGIIGIVAKEEPGREGPGAEYAMFLDSLHEFIDKGLKPYFKIFKRTLSYTFVKEPGLMVSKSEIILEPLPPGEKREADRFWANIGQWFKEKIGFF